MGAKVGGGNKGGMDEINVTPLIDIVLVLLIIFMVLTPITVQKMAAELPPVDDQPPPPPPPPGDVQLMIAIYKDGTLALNLQPLDEAKLRGDLRRQLLGRIKDKKNVFIDAHPDATYDTVVHVIDLSREAGAERVGFADLKDEGPAQLTPEQSQPPGTGAATPAPATP